jgi:hypothetical protein
MISKGRHLFKCPNQVEIMLINFRFLKCDEMGDKIVCKGERNFQNRKIIVSNLNLDGDKLPKTDLRDKKFENIGCKYATNLDGSALDCFSI